MRLVCLLLLTAFILGSTISCTPPDDDNDASDDDASLDDDQADDDADDDLDDDDLSDDDVDDDVMDDDATDDDTTDDDCDPLYPDLWIAGHRGANMLAPENSLPSLEITFHQGANAVEIDVRDTADGEYVLMHDDTVDRTTNGTGLVSDLTLTEIKDLLITDWMYGHVYGDLRVPTLQEALTVIAEHGGQVDIDMKTDEPEGAIEIVMAMGMESSCYVYSGDVTTLDRVRATSPDVRIQPATASVADTQALLDHFDPDPEHIELADGGLTPENVELIHSVGARVAMDSIGERDIFAFLGFKETWLSMMEGGVDIILSDLPGMLVDYRDSLCE